MARDPKRFIGYCPYCHGTLARMDIVPNKNREIENKRRVECRYCRKEFMGRRLLDARPLKPGKARVRTRWSAPSKQSIVKTFCDFFNLHPMITEAQIEAYRHKLTRSGWDFGQIKKLETEAAKKSLWSRNDELERRYRREAKHRPSKFMGEKFWPEKMLKGRR